MKLILSIYDDSVMMYVTFRRGYHGEVMHLKLHVKFHQDIISYRGVRAL